MPVRKIARALAEVKGNPSLAQSITLDTDILSEIGLDSLELTEFMLRVEEEFDVPVSYDRFELRYLWSVRALIDFLDECRKAPAPDGGGSLR